MENSYFCLCNNNQLEALIILSLFRHSTSTCFGHICSLSSGGILYIHNTYRLLHMYKYIYSKDVPRQAEVAQGVPGRLRPRIILTFQYYKGGRSSAKRTDRLYHRKNPWYSISEADSTSGHMVLSGVPRKKSPVTPPGIDPGTARLVVQRYIYIFIYTVYVLMMGYKYARNM